MNNKLYLSSNEMPEYVEIEDEEEIPEEEREEEEIVEEQPQPPKNNQNNNQNKSARNPANSRLLAFILHAA